MNLRRAVRIGPLLAALTLLPGGCNSSSPTDPLVGSPPYAGDWSGTSGQGRTVAFTVGGTGSSAKPIAPAVIASWSN